MAVASLGAIHSSMGEYRLARPLLEQARHLLLWFYQLWALLAWLYQLWLYLLWLYQLLEQALEAIVRP